MNRDRATAVMDRASCRRPAPAAVLAAGWIAVGAAGAAAQEGQPTTGSGAAEAIGPWIVSSDRDPATGGERHIAMTTSSQGSAVIGFRCVAGTPSALIGLNKGPISFAPGERIAVTIRTAGEPRVAAAIAASSELAEFDAEASHRLIREAAVVPSFALHLATPSQPDAALVFRPALTRRALAKLASACGIDLGAP
jgi:hypothetical protein